MSNVRKLADIGNKATEAYRLLAVTVARIGGGGCEVQPAPAATVFEKTFDEQAIKLVVKPVAFRLKERASSRRAEMLVVVTGEVHFSIDADRGSPLSWHFESEVAYFKKQGRFADHVFGVHYDSDVRTVGHPIFHAQFKSMAGALHTANLLLNENLTLRSDQMVGVEGKIRVPTAQMDPFSVFLQLVADHLLNVNTRDEEMETFEDVRAALSFFRTDPARASRLEQARRLNCFRASHWYPLPNESQSAQAPSAHAEGAIAEAVVAPDVPSTVVAGMG